MGSPVKPREWEKTLTVKCRLCGGSKCKRCSESAALAKTGSPVLGLHADWVTDRVLGMMRPSSRLMKDYKIAQQFTKLRVSAVFNLTLPGEHPYCGDGLAASGFPYDPETDLMQHNIRFYNFGWEDMTTPTLSFMMDIVKVMASVLQDGHQKIAVHCHAGYGRTGLAIACVLIFMHNIPPAQAVAIVRRDRPGSIQTAAQAKFVHRFHEYLNAAKVVFALPTIHDRFSVAEMVEHQNRTAHGERLAGTRSHALPKVLDFLCAAVERAAEAHPAAVLGAFVSHIPLRRLATGEPARDSQALEEAHVKPATPPPPVPSFPLNTATPSISQDDLFPIKVAFNVGETNWPDASDKCAAVTYFPVLLLDWLEHLAEPLLDTATLDMVTAHDGETHAVKSKALNKLPIHVIKSLERVVHCVRGLEQQAEVLEGRLALVDAVCTRTAMAVFHISDRAAPALARHTAFVAMLARDWHAPKRLELNLESLQKLGKTASGRKLSHTSESKHLESSPSPVKAAHRAGASGDHADSFETVAAATQPLRAPPSDLLDHLPKPRESYEMTLAGSASSSPVKIEPLHLHTRTPSQLGGGSPQKLEVPALGSLHVNDAKKPAGELGSPRTPLAPASPLKAASPLKTASLREKSEPEAACGSEAGASSGSLSGGSLGSSSSACSLPRVRGGDRYMNK